MRDFLRFGFINLAVLVGLLLTLNVVVIGIYQGVQFRQSLSATGSLTDSRAGLPNFVDYGWAEQHFEELRRAGVEYHSFYGWRRRPFAGQTITIDENGLRITPGAASPESEAPLVVFLGGSTMWGEGSDDHNTIPAHFVRLIGKPIRAENLGESAYNAFQSFLFLKLRTLEGWQPSLVISYDGINNVEGLCRAANRPIGHGRELQIREAMRGLDQRRTPDALTIRYFILPLQEFISRIRRRTDEGHANPYRLVCAEDAERAQAVAKKLVDSWNATLQLVERSGGQFVAILQPVAYVGSPRIDHLSLNPDVAHEYSAVYGRVLELLDTKEYRDLQPRVLDFRHAFDNSEFVYIDAQHVSPIGNESIAGLLLQTSLVASTLGPLVAISDLPDPGAR